MNMALVKLWLAGRTANDKHCRSEPQARDLELPLPGTRNCTSVAEFPLRERTASSRLVTTAFTALLLILSIGLHAGAQKRPRIGVAGTAAPPAPPAQTPVYLYNNGYVITAAPFVALSDGSILVNFGNGYERILRQCAVTRPVVDRNGLDAMGRLPLPLLQPFRTGERGNVDGSMPPANSAACYTMTNERRPRITR